MSLKKAENDFAKNCENQGEKQTTERTNGKTYLPCPHFQRTSHTTDMCGNLAKWASRPRRYKNEVSNHSTHDSPKTKTVHTKFCCVYPQKPFTLKKATTQLVINSTRNSF